jgi:hypothetical protein
MNDINKYALLNSVFFLLDNFIYVKSSVLKENMFTKKVLKKLIDILNKTSTKSTLVITKK